MNKLIKDNKTKALLFLSVLILVALVIIALLIPKSKGVSDYPQADSNEGRSIEEYNLVKTCDLPIGESYSCTNVSLGDQNITIGLFLDDDYSIRIYNSENNLIYREVIPRNFFTEDRESYSVYLENDASIHARGSIMIFKNQKAMFVGFIEESENNQVTILWKP